jgi:hypothetical protein
MYTIPHVYSIHTDANCQPPSQPARKQQRTDTMATELFEDIFEVRQVNPEGKKFDKGMYTSMVVLYLKGLVH